MNQAVQVYARVGFNVHTILMDGEFEKVKDKLPLLLCNTIAAKEHVSKAKRSIQMIKERAMGMICNIPFIYISQRLKKEFIYFVIPWPNVFLVKTGISTIYSPQELLVHWWLDYKKHCRVLSGMYCEAHDEPVSSNTMTACRESAGEHQILPSDNRMHSQTMLIHTDAHAQQRHQTGQQDWFM